MEDPWLADGSVPAGIGAVNAPLALFFPEVPALVLGSCWGADVAGMAVALGACWGAVFLAGLAACSGAEAVGAVGGAGGAVVGVVDGAGGAAGGLALFSYKQ